MSYGWIAATAYVGGTLLVFGLSVTVCFSLMAEAVWARWVNAVATLVLVFLLVAWIAESIDANRSGACASQPATFECVW